MKKLVSLIRATMTSDMNVFKIKQKKNNKKNNILLPIFLSLCLMFTFWSYSNALFEQLAPLGLEIIVLSLFVVITAFMTIIEGIYKTSSLLFNCKDDDLLLSLPIKKQTVFFIRIFKFYVFELIFNTLFILPVMIAYIRWAHSLDITYFITSFIMLFILPIIPIVLSCIISIIISSISSRFKYKNLGQIVLSTIFLLVIMYISLTFDQVIKNIAKHAASVNEFVTKIYYPAGAYAKLVTNFNIIDLLIFILVNIILFGISIFILSKFYYKINSRLKNVSTTSKKIKIDNITIKKRSITRTLINKEITTFVKTPVFIINAGFGLVLFIILAIAISFKFDTVVKTIIDSKIIEISKDMIINNIPIVIFSLIIFTSFMTSITNSLISLEGRNINILKSLPVKVKTILMSKIYACLVITTPMLIIGNIILFIRFKLGIIEMLLLLILSILIPLVSHFIGLIVNLKYPKLDFENSAEVVKQSMSSFLSVMIGMLLIVINMLILSKIMKLFGTTTILLIFVVGYIIIDICLYLYLTKRSVLDFNKLTI